MVRAGSISVKDAEISVVSAKGQGQEKESNVLRW